MRHFFFAAALIAGSLVSVQTLAALMQQQAMRGREVSSSFSPQADMPRLAQLSQPRV